VFGLAIVASVLRTLPRNVLVLCFENLVTDTVMKKRVREEATINVRVAKVLSKTGSPNSCADGHHMKEIFPTGSPPLVPSIGKTPLYSSAPWQFHHGELPC
jgi:hypothetical protein